MELKHEKFSHGSTIDKKSSSIDLDQSFVRTCQMLVKQNIEQNAMFYKEMILWFLFNLTWSQRPECEVPSFALESGILNAFLYTVKDQINLDKNLNFRFS